MGLNNNFPKSPYAILNPNIRWFPGDESLGEKGNSVFETSPSKF